MTFFIAEVSSNHSQNIDRALSFIDVAANIGCDAVKFQLFRIEKLFAPEILEKSKKHRDRKNWELPIEFLPVLAKRCRERGIKFGCSPFYLDAVKELEPFVDFYKVASYELLWQDLLAACAKTKKNVIISTGMATISEITKSVELLRKYECEPTILHCTSAYPTPHKDANLKAIATIREASNCSSLGWSDHTVNPAVIHRAVHKWGAEVIEFHLDLDGEGAEYETGHCWLPREIGSVIEQIKQGVESDGLGEKKPVEPEIADLLWLTDNSDGLRPNKSIRDTFLS